MNFQEKDIDFSSIDWMQFEELCFDLLMKYQFHEIVWHQGSSDSGRDIEASFTIMNPLINAYTERWFFECKYYKGGVPVEEMVTKIAWASAHRVKHFVLMTNSHPTKSTRDYLKEIQKSVNFKIHVIDGKMIRLKLLSFPELIVKYFADDTIVWVKSLVKQWLFHDSLPDIKTLYNLFQAINPDKLSKEELAFLMFSYVQSEYDEESLPDDVNPFNAEFLWEAIKVHKNEHYPINLDKENLSHHTKWSGLGSSISRNSVSNNIHFLIQGGGKDSRTVQLFLKREGKQLVAKIACRD